MATLPLEPLQERDLQQLCPRSAEAFPVVAAAPSLAQLVRRTPAAFAAAFGVAAGAAAVATAFLDQAGLHPSIVGLPLDHWAALLEDVEQLVLCR